MKRLSQFSLIILTFLLLFHSCSRDIKRSQFERVPAARTGIHFSNQLKESEALNIITFEYFYNGAGVGIGDVNNDSLPDIFFAANMSANKLYLNKGNFRFEDISEKAGILPSDKWATGVSMVDINQDGWTDIYVCYAGPFSDPRKRENELYVNNHDGTFSERAKAYGLNDTGHSVQAAFFDFDLDGDLDVYILTNTTDEIGPNIIRAKKIHGEMINTDRLYRNNGNNTFSDVSLQAGITIEGYGLGVSICDINHDRWPDIFVSNDYLSNDILYINNGNGTFTDRAPVYFDHTSYSAMGNDIADFNNDGWLDIIEVDMLPPDNKRQKLMFGATNYDRFQSEIKSGYQPQYMRNSLQLGRGKDRHGNLIFSEIGQLSGVHATDWSWSPLFADVDNDGWKDIIITNGYPRDITNRDFALYKAHEMMHEGYHEGVKNKLLNSIREIDGAHLPNFVFQNSQDLTFSDRSEEWGFTESSYSTGAAFADLDNDGDLDYVTNNIDKEAFIFENHATELSDNHFLRIRFTGPAGNLGGLGTKFFLSTSSGQQTQEYYPCRGYQSSVDPVLHFGLGKDTLASLKIQWPDGRIQELHHITVDQTIRIRYDDKLSVGLPIIPTKSSPRYSKMSDIGIDYKHAESPYADFKIQRLLPQQYSQQGPGIAVADCNGDGLDDFFVGGAFNQSGSFYIQDKKGHFSATVLTHDKKYEEDIGVLLFDADNDLDNDLYVVSGGSEFQEGSQYYQDRFYRNNGHGKFERDDTALPRESASGSCVVAGDYDRDGDLDLFVGGRLSPQHYPQPGKSFILENEHGKFKDVTDQLAAGLKDAGMITSALWTDFNNDGYVDLVVVGEWMPVTLFKNTGKGFQNVTSMFGLQNTSGWWNSIQGADVDRDGDVDYVLGNVGLNSRYKASPENPVVAVVGDFNNDAVTEGILATKIKGVYYPIPPRDDLLQQLPSFKKFYPNYISYAQETLEGLKKRSPQAKTDLLKCEITTSSVLINEGNKNWKLVALPIEAQMAPVNGVLIDYFSADENVDIILSGNSYAPDVLTGRYDAMKGLVLTNTGNGKYKAIGPESGLFLNGDSKGLATLHAADGHAMILSTCNNDSLRVFKCLEKNNVIHLHATDRYAESYFSDGSRSRTEFYFGSGYLSQSALSMNAPGNVTRVVIFDYTGKSRTVEIPVTK